MLDLFEATQHAHSMVKEIEGHMKWEMCVCVHACDLCLYACTQTVTLNLNLVPLSLDNIFSESETINACYLNRADCMGFPGSTN